MTAPRPRGAVAAGHPETAEAGAWALREGGNATDAAVAAIATSMAVESPLTGLGAGGYMLVFEPGAEPALLDFFVAAPGLGDRERRSELNPIDVDFGGTVQVFNIGAASCGVPGTPAGLVEANRRWGSMPLETLLRPAIGHARNGVHVNRQQAYLLEILGPILTHEPEGMALYAPGGSPLTEGDRFVFAELAEALELLAAEGADPYYRGDVAGRICDWVGQRGGQLAPEDLAAYEPVARDPVRIRFMGSEILTNPPPSSGGLLIALVLALLERLERADLPALVAAMEEAQEARSIEFVQGLSEPGFADRFLEPHRVAEAERRCRDVVRPGGRRAAPGDALGSTTHITAVDGEGRCASVTCSNGTGSGLLVPGTGVHVNNMLGEQDLNPFGFHEHEPTRRLPSMMSPTVVLRNGELEAGMGSAGSNRIRDAVAQAIVRIVVDGMEAAD
ncbi:MAG TPA: gamma-glutamyltransferase, partial [Solirubrobacterales bacterium]|nr:gamma-glutamyltransferase [Solirubrobacterales bacterium]